MPHDEAKMLDNVVRGGYTDNWIAAGQAGLLFGLERGDLTHLLNHFGPNLRVIAFQFGDFRVLADPSPITGGFVALGDVLGQR